MAKISINDRCTNGNVINRTILNRLLEGSCNAIERLGNAAETIEVIKISPTYASEEAPLVSVKLVISNNGPNGQGQAKIEKEFDMFCNEGMEDFIAQRIISSFQETVVKLADQLNKRAEELRGVLANLSLREQESKNDLRCPMCGHMPTAQIYKKPCPQCAKYSVEGHR